MAYNVIISELHVPEMFFGDHDYYIQILITVCWIHDVMVISFIAWAGICMCVLARGRGGGELE